MSYAEPVPGTEESATVTAAICLHCEQGIVKLADNPWTHVRQGGKCADLTVGLSNIRAERGKKQ
jgi:hypothetical protein